MHWRRLLGLCIMLSAIIGGAIVHGFFPGFTVDYILILSEVTWLVQGLLLFAVEKKRDTEQE